MDVKSTFIITFIGQLYAVVYKTEAEDRTCCNGTLGYAANAPKIPCEAMTCCNPSETVVAFPINAGIGYGFRCTAELPNTCYKSGERVFTTDDSTITYGDRYCCGGKKFKLVFHSQDGVALSIECDTS